MKRVISALLLAGLLAGCVPPAPVETPASQATETPAAGESAPSENVLAFEISSPIQFASYNYRITTLVLECVSGSYDAARIPYGQAWSGRFRFRRTDASRENEVSESDTLSPEMDLAFNTPFDLYHIYMGSSGPFFVLTQFGSTSGGDYGKLFFWHENDMVEEVPIRGDRRYISAFGLISLSEEDSGCFLLPYRHTPGSLPLETTENGFVVRTEDPFVRSFGTDEIYFMGTLDPENAKDVSALEDIYLWNGTAFVLTEQRLIYDEPGKE